jgi:hypothetical protein
MEKCRDRLGGWRVGLEGQKFEEKGYFHCSSLVVYDYLQVVLFCLFNHIVSRTSRIALIRHS